MINWALINDERNIGITVHHVDENIDTGDIILQSTLKIDDKDNYYTLLYRCYDACANLLLRLSIRSTKTRPEEFLKKVSIQLDPTLEKETGRRKT